MFAKQYKLDNGMLWIAVSTDDKHTLERSFDGYVEYQEGWDTEDELLQSMKEIAPISEWIEYED